LSLAADTVHKATAVAFVVLGVQAALFFLFDVAIKFIAAAACPCWSGGLFYA
jgi:hypothetical protein